MGRLLTFVAGAISIATGLSQGSLPWLLGGAASFALFFVLVVVHASVLTKRSAAEIRRAVHERHLRRIDGSFSDLPSTGDHLVGAEHPYARDLDLVGCGSLFQRIDVTRTVDGERTLLRWLSEPAEREMIAARREAVRELTDGIELRQELEAAGGGEDEKLDTRPFLRFLGSRAFVSRGPWFAPVIHLLPLLTVGLLVLGIAGFVRADLWLMPLLVQSALILFTGSNAREVFDLITARRGYVEAFSSLLGVVEGTQWRSKLLQTLSERTAPAGRPPSVYLRRLDRWAGLAELRHQVLFHLPLNFLLLWDLHVLLRLERWRHETGAGMEDVFTALAEIEALAALATLAYVDADASFPEIVDEPTPFEAVQLAHPLLMREVRVANDVSLSGPSAALIVTGSNMAGKSTLLRTVGLNVALALAGGPVIARSMRLSRVRLRASLRADDSLQRGASYFQAELTKLRGVVGNAEASPPVFFLLDELLRGTNARARHLGAKAVLLHLLDRGAMGLVATHDVALSELEEERASVTNAHFTDVMKDGEMVFDYRLRPGVVQTSNALRLLQNAGIEVPEDDMLAISETKPFVERPPGRETTG